MDEYYYNKHYIQLREDGAITDGWSDGPHPERDTEGATLLTDRGGYQFRLSPEGEENPALWDMDGIPLYKYADGAVVRRTGEELEAERARIPPPPPTELEQLRADVDFIYAMEGLL